MSKNFKIPIAIASTRVVSRALGTLTNLSGSNDVSRARVSRRVNLLCTRILSYQNEISGNTMWSFRYGIYNDSLPIGWWNLLSNVWWVRRIWADSAYLCSRVRSLDYDLRPKHRVKTRPSEEAGFWDNRVLTEVWCPIDCLQRTHPPVNTRLRLT